MTTHHHINHHRHPKLIDKADTNPCKTDWKFRCSKSSEICLVCLFDLLVHLFDIIIVHIKTLHVIIQWNSIFLNIQFGSPCIPEPVLCHSLRGSDRGLSSSHYVNKH